MATLKGRAVTWGVGVVAAVNGGWTTAAASGIIVASHETALEANQREIMNQVGDAVGIVFSNVRRSLTIEVIPTSTSSVTAVRALNYLPNVGEYVTITDTESTDLDGTHSGKYIFTGGSKSATQDGEQRMTLQLVQYIDNDLSATIT